MTNFEKLTKDKEALIDILDDETPFGSRMTDWWCVSGRCPHSVNGECIHEVCKYLSDREIIENWLDSEVEE